MGTVTKRIRKVKKLSKLEKELVGIKKRLNDAEEALQVILDQLDTVLNDVGIIKGDHV